MRCIQYSIPELQLNIRGFNICEYKYSRQYVFLDATFEKYYDAFSNHHNFPGMICVAEEKVADVLKEQRVGNFLISFDVFL